MGSQVFYSGNWFHAGVLAMNEIGKCTVLSALVV